MGDRPLNSSRAVTHIERIQQIVSVIGRTGPGGFKEFNADTGWASELESD